jgi:ABC-2 type transport system permease protein
MWLALFGSSLGNAPKAVLIYLFGTSNYMSFILPGVLGITMITIGMFASMSLIQDKRYGYLKRIMVAPVSGEVPATAKMLGGITRGLIEVPILIIIAILLGAKINLSMFSIGIVIIVSILLCAFSSSLFILLTIKTADLQAPGVVSSLLLFPLMFSSSAMFPSSLFPSWLKAISNYNPLTFAVDVMREALLGKAVQYITLIKLLGYSLLLFVLLEVFSHKYLTAE